MMQLPIYKKDVPNLHSSQDMAWFGNPFITKRPLSIWLINTHSNVSEIIIHPNVQGLLDSSMFKRATPNLILLHE